MSLRIKLRKIPRGFRKFFGFVNEKWARGHGKYGYGRHYGASRHGGTHIDHRTKEEKLNDRDRQEIPKELLEYDYETQEKRITKSLDEQPPQRRES